MKVPEISIMLENTPARFYEVTRSFADAGVDLKALMLADRADSAVLRLLVSDIAAARRVLMKMHLRAWVEDVVACAIEDKPGSLAELLKPLMEANVGINYMYALTGGAGEDKAVMIFNFTDNDRAIEVLKKAGTTITDIEKLRSKKER